MALLTSDTQVRARATDSEGPSLESHLWAPFGLSSKCVGRLKKAPSLLPSWGFFWAKALKLLE